MCGIFATLRTVEDQQTITDLLLGLKKLEYRGYDSWGIAYLQNKKLASYKQLGNLDKQKNLAQKRIASQIALGHTRWATHGSVCLKNTHPHLDKKQGFALVHNGVIENYQELKKKLQKVGYSFQSETDTELIVALISMALDKKSKNISSKLLKNIQKQLVGRNTFVILEKSGNFFLSKNGLSLFLAKDKQNNYYLSSDLISLPESCRYFYRFLDKELLLIKEGRMLLIDCNDQKKNIHWQKLKVQKKEIDQNQFTSAMFKEINEQKYLYSELWKNLSGEKLKKIKKIIQKKSKIFLIGAGSAYHVAHYLSYQLRSNNFQAFSINSGEVSSYLNLIDQNSLVIAISQSGETADTLEAVEKSQKNGAFALAVVNSPQSSLAHLSDYCFDLNIGKEIAVASTKAVTAQMAWGNFLLKKINGKSNLQEIKQEQKKLTHFINICNQQSQELANLFLKEKNCFILGQDKFLALAQEFALKLKEIAYLHAEGLASSELKHGVLALVEKETLIFALVTDNQREKNTCLNSLAEAKSRGAKIIGVSKEKNTLFDKTILIPQLNILDDIAYIIPAQLLSYHLAVKAGRNPDRPRNLAKSVTVK